MIIKISVQQKFASLPTMTDKIKYFGELISTYIGGNISYNTDNENEPIMNVSFDFTSLCYSMKMTGGRICSTIKDTKSNIVKEINENWSTPGMFSAFKSSNNDVIGFTLGDYTAAFQSACLLVKNENQTYSILWTNNFDGYHHIVSEEIGYVLQQTPTPTRGVNADYPLSILRCPNTHAKSMTKGLYFAFSAPYKHEFGQKVLVDGRQYIFIGAVNNFMIIG